MHFALCNILETVVLCHKKLVETQIMVINTEPYHKKIHDPWGKEGKVLLKNDEKKRNEEVF